MRNSEVLDRTADVIEEHGWRTGPGGWGGSWGYSVDPVRALDGKLCLEGGLLCTLGITVPQGDRKTAVLDQFHASPVYRALQEYLGIHEDPGYERFLWWWNDHEADATRVVEVLRGAAAVERAKEEALSNSDTQLAGVR